MHIIKGSKYHIVVDKCATILYESRNRKCQVFSWSFRNGATKLSVPTEQKIQRILRNHKKILYPYTVAIMYIYIRLTSQSSSLSRVWVCISGWECNSHSNTRCRHQSIAIRNKFESEKDAASLIYGSIHNTDTNSSPIKSSKFRVRTKN